ncbi:DNA polymerase III subunit alpha [Candidatus Peregrinibacteria bacterium CG10_big_fil_rev_8_21_14_0_10_36_19]|nr:MAG: DNA polymerase III subunit alpha [Candidatus Peregrinibacteria bacterium CG10_big_fil_rev_8_21_14_0_10_36_19]
MSFVNLHAHSHYSLLDGFGSPESIILRSKELGYPAAALTDHGVTYGLVEFFKAGKKHGVKPILGCELYVATRTRFDKEAKVDVKPYHLTAIAKNNIGYENLLKLTTKAHLEGFYYKPRVDYGLLKTYSEGLIVLSGCLASHLSRAILSGNEEDIKKVIENHIEIFGKENYFLEMQDQPLIENQLIVNKRLKELAKEYGLGIVVSCDSHYARPSDKEVHDVLLCIQTGSTVHDEHRMRYTGDYSIREVEDLKKAFPDCPEAITNTLKIADMCNVDFEFGVNLIPSFNTPQNEDAAIYLRTLCGEGLINRFKGVEIPDGYKERLDFELGVVNSMGFDTYFLIVSDFVRYAKDKGIVVGPGRGSAAGSIIAWVLDITDVDPIKYGLFFERFLNPERVSMPDIDIDFADHRRDEVLTYVVEKYGRERVAQILTFGTMAPRAAVRDVGRALGYPYQEVDTLSKTIPPPVLGKQVPLMESVENDPELKKVYNNDARAKALLDYAIKLEGTVRHIGTHACAVVISEKDLTHYTALQYGASGGGEIVTQYSAKPLEDLGLLKMDFLGLRNLTIIENTVETVKRRRGEIVDINTISLEDEATFKLLQKGDTTGVFQLESGGMKRYLKELKPTIFDDIVAMGALYRPGPMEWIPTYIKGKHNPDKVKYLDPSFKSILENTYGVAVYQEQILQLARDFAGFSLGEADLLRKAVGKKIPELLAEQREMFVKGSVKNGHKEKFAMEVFEKVVEPFAGYGFNKAHAVCYGMIAYQTAYLKAHYPVEFMNALLCSDANVTDRVVLEIKECNEMGIDVLPPSINESFANFTVVDDKTIRFGLLAIKGIGDGPVSEVIAEREKNGKFKSLDDFARRVPSKNLNKKLIQAAAYSGALDEWGDRKQIAENYEEISKYAKGYQQSVSNGQTDIFGIMENYDEVESFQMRNVPKAGRMENLKWEKEFLGMYVSGHPLQGLRPYIARKGSLIGNLTRKKVGKVVKVIGLVSGLRKMMTKTGGYMAMFSLEDPSGKINAVIFPKTMNSINVDLADDIVLSVSGKFDDKRGQCQILCEQVKAISISTMVQNAKEAGQFDENDKSAFSVRLIDDILADQDAEDESFLIEVPKDASPEKMTQLKDLLIENKGEFPVELDLIAANKRIKLPFGVELTDDLKSKVKSLLES